MFGRTAYVLVAAVLVAGCSGGDGQGVPTAPPSQNEAAGTGVEQTGTPSAAPSADPSVESPPAMAEAAPLADHDPPLEFDSTSIYEEDVWHHHVDGDVMYGVTEKDEPEVTVWEIASGAELGTVELNIEGELATGGVHEPALNGTVIDDRYAVLVAREFIEPGSGTEQDSVVIQVEAFFGDDGSNAWTQVIEVPSTVNYGRLALQGGDPDHLLVYRSGEPYGDATWALRADTGEVLQQWPGFKPFGLESDTAVGWWAEDEDGEPQSVRATPERVQGRNIATGEIAWELEASSDLPFYDYGRSLGGGMIFQLTHGSHGGLVLDAATGERVLHVGQDHSGVYCSYDQVDTVVCARNGGDFLAAYSVDSRERLWNLEEISEGRVIPHGFGTAYHGALYMRSTSAGERDRPPVVLDVRTGDDLADYVPEVMHQVGAGYGIYFADYGATSKYGVKVYPSTG